MSTFKNSWQSNRGSELLLNQMIIHQLINRNLIKLINLSMSMATDARIPDKMSITMQMGTSFT